MSDTINPNANISISKEEKITIANDDTSSNSNKKPLITVQTETEILKKIEKHCNTWNSIATAYNVCIIVFGISAVSTSVIVSIYTGQEKLISVAVIKVLACISTISLSILTAFNLVSNASNARTAWRSLNAAMMLYKAGSISIQQLIEQYQQGENQLGTISFNYGTNSDKPATYSHDIKGKEDEQKGSQEDETITSKQNADTSRKNEDINKQNADISKQMTDESKQNADVSGQNTDTSKQNEDVNEQNADISKQITDVSKQNADTSKTS